MNPSGIFFFGLAAAILSGHFWPVFLVALAICSLVGSLSSSKAQAIYAGFQGFVFFLGLAVCSVIGFWPWILVVLGIEAILGSLNGLWAIRPVARPSIIVDQYYSAIRHQDYARAYRFLDASLTSTITQEQFTKMAQEQDAAYGPVSRASRWERPGKSPPFTASDRRERTERYLYILKHMRLETDANLCAYWSHAWHTHTRPRHMSMAALRCQEYGLLSSKTLEQGVDRIGSELHGLDGNALVSSVNGLHEVERFGQLHRNEAIGLNAQPREEAGIRNPRE